MCLHPECSTCPYATANPRKLTASAYFSLPSLVTHNNISSQRNMEIHTYDEGFLLILYHRPLQCQVITINVLKAAPLRGNAMCAERRNVKQSDVLIGSSLENPHLSLFGPR